MKKLVWLDNSDPIGEQNKLNSLRTGQCSEWEWIKFDEDQHKNVEDAYRELVGLICTPPMFSFGKVVYCRGVPLKKNSADYHRLLCENFDCIPDKVVLIILAKPDKQGILYKKFLEFAEKDLALVEKPAESSMSHSLNVIETRARALNIKLDKNTATMLADMCDNNISKICMELYKLKHVAQNGVITQEIVYIYCDGKGTSDIMKLGDFILGRHREHAHELLQRLIEKGDDPIKICGFLQDWLLRLAIVASCKSNLDTIKMSMSSAKKWKRKDGQTIDQEKIYDSDKWINFIRVCGESIPMFANLGSFYFSCKSFSESNRDIEWAYKGYSDSVKLQISLKAGGNSSIVLDKRFGRHISVDNEKITFGTGRPDVLMHLFVDSLID